MMQSAPEKLDDGAYIIYLEMPGSKVVNLQAHFEIYEGVGIVRTLDIRRSLVSILTTADMLQDCVAILDALQETVPWRAVPRPPDLAPDRFLGYFRRENHA